MYCIVYIFPLHTESHDHLNYQSSSLVPKAQSHDALLTLKPHREARAWCSNQKECTSKINTPSKTLFYPPQREKHSSNMIVPSLNATIPYHMLPLMPWKPPTENQDTLVQSKHQTHRNLKRAIPDLVWEITYQNIT